MSIAIDDGPLDTMPNISPSCTSSFEISLNRSRMRPGLWNCRCRSSMNERKMRPHDGARGGGPRARRGEKGPRGGRGGAGCPHVGRRPPGDGGHLDDVLLDAIL